MIFMNSDEKLILAKIIGAMAWADGELHPQELRQALVQLGHLNLSDVNLEEMVKNSNKFPWEMDFNKSPITFQLETMKRCFLVARAHYGMAMTEEAMLRKMALQIMPNKPWLQVKKWLELFFTFETETLAVLGTSEYL